MYEVHFPPDGSVDKEVWIEKLHLVDIKLGIALASELKKTDKCDGAAKRKQRTKRESQFGKYYIKPFCY